MCFFCFLIVSNYTIILHLQVYSGFHHYHNLHHIYPPSHHHQSPRQTVVWPIIIQRGGGWGYGCNFIFLHFQSQNLLAQIAMVKN